MVSITAGQRRGLVGTSWYNPFVRLETPYDASQAAMVGGGMALVWQGLGVLGTFLHVLSFMRHPTLTSNAFYGACADLVATLLLAVLFAATAIAIFRRQAVWAAVTLAGLVGVGAFLQLGHGLFTLIRLPTMMSIGGSILCVRGALMLKRRKLDLNEVFS